MTTKLLIDRAELEEAYRLGFIAACYWPEPASQDVDSASYKKERDFRLTEILYRATPSTLRVVSDEDVERAASHAFQAHYRGSAYEGMSWLSIHPSDGERWIRSTRAALESLPAVKVPDGWRLVPVEPTEDMYMAGQWAHYQAEEECRIEIANADGHSFFNEKPETMRRRKNRAAHVYKAMLAAAPNPNDAKDDGND